MSGDRLKRTPFFDFHVASKAKIAPFARFAMPVHYETGVKREHLIVRTSAGVFDVSHMGEFEISGPDRNAFVNRPIPRHWYDVYLAGRRVDMVRSGGFSPSLQAAIGTTYLPIHSTEPGTKIEIDCRGKRVDAEVVTMPFYRDGSVRSRRG